MPRKFIPNSIAIENVDYPSHVPMGYFRDIIFETTRVLYGEKLCKIIEKSENNGDPNIESLINIFDLNS